MSNWIKRIREYDRVVGEREAAKTARAVTERQRVSLAQDNVDLKLDLRRAHDDIRRLERELTEARELLMRADRDHAQLSGQLADAKAQLASFELAETIDDETRAKRYYDGQGDE